MPRAVQFDQYGDVDVLHVAEVPMPQPDRGGVVVSVRAAGTNPGEAPIRSGAMKERFPADFPSGQGSDFAGVVSAVGAGVEGITAGDEVLGWSDHRSSQAEFVAVPAGHVVPKPPELPWEVAGALYVVGVTASVCVDAVDAGPGDTVAVSAAAGGVGSIAVQLLVLAGAEVIGIASEHHHSWLQSVGVTPVSYGAGLAERLRAAAPRGIDAFVDAFGDDYVPLAVDLGVPPERINTIIDFDAASKYHTKAEGSQAADDPAGALAEVAELAASGRIQVPVSATYPMDRVREAYRQLEQRHTLGKIVLIP